LAGKVSSLVEKGACFAHHGFEQRDDFDDEADVFDVEERTLHDEVAVDGGEELELESDGQLFEDALVRFEPLVGESGRGVFEGFGQTVVEVVVDLELVAELFEVLQPLVEQRALGVAFCEEGGDQSDGVGVEHDSDEHPQDDRDYLV